MNDFKQKIFNNKFNTWLAFVFIGFLSPQTTVAFLSDEEIVKSFTATRTVQKKSGENVTFSFSANPPRYETTIAYDSTQQTLENFCTEYNTTKLRPLRDRTIPFRVMRLYFNTPEEAKKGVIDIGHISLREIFSQGDNKNKKSSFLTLNNISVIEYKQNKGFGSAALSCFLKMLDDLDPSKISHDVYAVLGNSNLGVFKMYLDKGFNYFVNKQNMKIFDIHKCHNDPLLKQLQNNLASPFPKENIPTSCLLKREEKKRLYEPYFF